MRSSLTNCITLNQVKRKGLLRVVAFNNCDIALVPLRFLKAIAVNGEKLKIRKP